MSEKFLIVANGEFLDRSIIVELARDSLILALDGASTRLARLGIKPNFILGDFDSIEESGSKDIWGITATGQNVKEEDLPYEGKYGITIVPAKNQDLTDLQKGIQFCKSQNAEEINIVCALGGRVDHELMNLRTLKSEESDSCKLYLHSNSQTIFFVKDGTFEVSGEIGDYFGLVAFPAAKFQSTGLKYNGLGDGYELIFSQAESVCNTLESKTVNFTVEGNALAISPGVLSSQREVSSLNEIKALELKLHYARYSLLELSAKEFRQAKENLKHLKSNVQMEKLTRENKLNSCLYVNCSKKEAIETLEGNDPLLLSVTEEKRTRFLFFSKNDFSASKPTVEYLNQLAEQHYPDRLGCVK